MAASGVAAGIHGVGVEGVAWDRQEQSKEMEEPGGVRISLPSPLCKPLCFEV